MGFGKRVCEILAVAAAIVLIGALVWYFSSGTRDRGYEREGTLVREERNSTDWEDAYPAFVTDPVSMICGDAKRKDVIQRSGKGL